jgi:hypothetical protein
MRRGLFESVWLGPQAFNFASAFNQNLASWNVLRVSNFGSAFGSTTALSACNKKAMYTAWGSTFQSVWPGFMAATCTVSSLTNGNIAAAVTAWIGGDATTYGNIADWNTAAVKTMANLFQGKSTFNADISKWNVASVSNMFQVDPLCRVHQTPRLVWRSLIGRHFSTALFGLGACSCRTRTHAGLPCLATRCAAAAPACHSHAYTFPWRWLGMARCWAHTCRPRPSEPAGHACMLHCFPGVYSPTYSVVRDSTEALSGFCPHPTAAGAPHLDGPAPHSARTLQAHWALRAQCTELTVRPSGLMRRGLFASVWFGSQAFYDAKAFNANIGAWNTAAISNMASVCLVAIACVCEVCGLAWDARVL